MLVSKRYYSPYATFEELSGPGLGIIPLVPFLGSPDDITDVTRLQKQQITLQIVNAALMTALIGVSIYKLWRS